jgi:hypothetical protein
MLIAGGRPYNNQQFKDHMNRLYYPLSAMQKSVEILKESNQLDLSTMEFGDYQSVLSPLDRWPGDTGKKWLKSKDYARAGLASQPNSAPLSADEPSVMPLTKCGLLDASVRKCFNSEPPIPMQVDIQEQGQDAPNAAQHDIRLVWTYGSDGIPTLLRLTMVCPYGSGRDDAEPRPQKVLAEAEQ